MESVVSVSQKPGIDGNVFASAEFLNGGALRIFDIRRSTSSSELNAVG